MARKSPTESATKFPVGTKRKGNDGNMWVIKKAKNGVKRWVKAENAKEQLAKKIEKKLYRWWLSNLAEGTNIIIYKNGTAKKSKDTSEKKWTATADDPNVSAILWSAASTDALYYFAMYIVYKKTAGEIKKLVTYQKGMPAYILKNYKKYFDKYEIHSAKDYTLKYFDPED